MINISTSVQQLCIASYDEKVWIIIFDHHHHRLSPRHLLHLPMQHLQVEKLSHLNGARKTSWFWWNFGFFPLNASPFVSASAFTDACRGSNSRYWALVHIMTPLSFQSLFWPLDRKTIYFAAELLLLAVMFFLCLRRWIFWYLNL